MHSSHATAKLPLVAITLGDPAGVGPEVVARSWPEIISHSACTACVVGNPDVLRRAVKLVGGGADVVEVQAVEDGAPAADSIPCLRCGASAAADVPPGRNDARGGQAAYDALQTAARLALDGHVQAIVTAPLSKTALHAAGHHYPGHTELLAELCGVDQVAMMLYLPQGPGVRGRVGLGVVHVTLHAALRDAVQSIDQEAIVNKALLADGVVQALLGTRDANQPPRLAICALNPHAGEGGLFGDEELRIIGPAAQQCRARGLNIEGPLPADTLLMRAAAGEFDAVVAMYHDQGHIALKLLGMHRAVNITLGLPIVRTSVAHGTAFDLAWQGRAESAGMVQAVRVAVQLAGARMKDEG